MISGVVPLLLAWFTLAFAASSFVTISAWPCVQAVISGVSPPLGLVHVGVRSEQLRDDLGVAILAGDDGARVLRCHRLLSAPPASCHVGVGVQRRDCSFVTTSVWVPVSPAWFTLGQATQPIVRSAPHVHPHMFSTGVATYFTTHSSKTSATDPGFS